MASQSMYVVKRDGTKEPVHFEKVQQRIASVSYGLSVDPTLIAQRVLVRLFNGVRTTELDDLAAQLSISLCTTHPDYGTLAARIAVSNHQRSTEPSFLKVVETLSTQIHPKTGEPISYVSGELLEAARRFSAEIDAALDHERDFLFDYFGFKTLEKSYLLKSSAGRVLERPQHLWMRVALALWPTDFEKARETYDLMSQKAFTHATPTLFNAGTPNQQLSSCFLIAMKSDSIKGIYDTLEDCAMISKHAGGIGLHCSNVRAKGSIIRGTNGTSNGLVPMLKVFNTTARYVDQCFTPETLITTENGNIPISSIVAGLRVITSEGLKTVRALVPHKWNGPMYRIHIEGKDSVVQVTAEHDLLSVKSLGDSKDLVQQQLGSGLKSADYLTVDQLAVGDFVVDYNGALNMIMMFDKVDYDGDVYDLEVDEPHNYRVLNLGIAHNGGGKRNGSFAIYLEPWHADVEDFLRLKLNTGTEEDRARDLFYALWVPDLFMERVAAGGTWTLFCPAEAPGLADVVGADFKALYERYEREGRGRKTVPAQDLWFQILATQIETGTPYLCYKDAANAKSNQKNLGIIKSSNLCVAPETEILTDAGALPISSLVGTTVRVWNGASWSAVVPTQTGTDQELMEIVVKNTDADGNISMHTLNCTLYHKFILADGSRADASTLTSGQKLVAWSTPLIVYADSEVQSITFTGRRDNTFCFSESERQAGVFNGILTGNCTEIMEYSAPDETAVCNLASIGLPYFMKDGAFDYAALRRVVATIVRNLDRVIDINFYPTPETRRSNMRHRPIGLGVQGLADVFAIARLSWETEAAADLNQRIFEHIYYAAVETSAALAAELGTYETFAGSPVSKGQLQPDLWNVKPLTEADGSLDWTGLKVKAAAGLRNSLLVAPMPTASTSQILGYNECIEPFTSNIYSRRTLAGEFVVINKYLMRDLMNYGIWTEELKQKIIANNGSVQGLAEVPQTLQQLYKTAWELKQRTLIDMAADRGAFICQSQSLNLFISEPTNAKLTSMHFHAWRRGLKTGIYYLRTKAPIMAQKFTVDPELQAAVIAAQKAAEPEVCLTCSA